MAWNGYLGLGTVSAGVFTELALSGYARQAFTFATPAADHIVGSGPLVDFGTVGATAWTYQAYAFFTAVSGGNPVLSYPLVNAQSVQPGSNCRVPPGSIVVDIVGELTAEGQQLDGGGIGILAATLPNILELTSASGLVAHAGGGQAAALQLSSSVNRISTVAAIGDSVRLPVSTAGNVVIIINAAVLPCGVFGVSPDTINGQPTASGIQQPGNSIEVYVCGQSGTWHCEAGEGYSGSFFTESARDNIVAFAGGGQTNATLLLGQTSRVVTVASALDSVKLPVSAAGLEINVINASTNPMGVFGSGTDTIDGVATATGVQQMPSSMCIYSCATAGSWASNGLGTGYAGSLPTQSFKDNIVAFATGGQASATQLAAVLNRIVTVATAADSCKLPAAVGGLSIAVFNAAVNSANIFPATGDQINGAGANVAFAVAGGKTATFLSAGTLNWHCIISA